MRGPAIRKHHARSRMLAGGIPAARSNEGDRADVSSAGGVTLAQRSAIWTI
jgi:hypothetical protein